MFTNPSRSRSFGSKSWAKAGSRNKSKSAPLRGEQLEVRQVLTAAIDVVSPGEFAGMQKLYAVDNNAFLFNAPYTVNNSVSIPTGSFNRVAYFVELGGNWVWTSMDAFKTNPLQVGVPKHGSGIVEGGTVVKSLNVEASNGLVTAPGPGSKVTPGTGLTGIIEFWPSNYNQNGGGLFGSNNSKFDWKDGGFGTSNGHGSFQVHAFNNPGMTSANTIFGITHNGGSGLGDQIPNGSNASQDWTFGPNAASYGIRNVEVWVGTTVYVDDAWAGFTAGQAIVDADPVLAGDQPGVFGTNAFATSTTALAAPVVGAGSLIVVNAGNYSTEAVNINKSVTMRLQEGPITFGSLDDTVTNATVILDGVTLTTGGNNSSTQFNSLITGTGGLTKVGTGTMTLGSVNTYSGATLISAGTIASGVDHALPTGTALTLGTGTTAGNLNLGNFLQTVASLNVSSTSAAAVNVITVAPTRTLTVTGNVTVGIAGAGLTTNLTATGGGNVAFTSGTSIVDIGFRNNNNANTENRSTTDFTGLGSFTANVATFRVGFESKNRADFLLSNTANIITANTISVGDSGANNASPASMILGDGTNVFNATTMEIGSGKGNGTLKFALQAAGSPGTFTLRGKTGGTSTANLSVGFGDTSTAGTVQAVLDLRGHVVDAAVGTLYIARRTVTSSAITSSLSFDAGTITANSVFMADITNGTVATGTLNVDGGTFTVNAAFRLAMETAAATVGNGTLNVTGGEVVSNVDIVDGGVTTTTEINIAGGTLNLAGNNIGTIANPIDNFDFTGGRLENVNLLNRALTQQGGALQLGADAAAGTMTIEGDYDLQAAGSLEIDLNGTAGAGMAGGHDQLDVNGAVTLAGDLEVSVNYAPTSGNSFTILTATSITGEFNGLADGAQVILDGQPFVIDYTPTSVALTFVDAPVITGTASDDIFFTRVVGSHIEVYSGTDATGTLLMKAAQTSLTNLTLEGGAGDDTLIIDYTNPITVPISFAGGADSDAIEINGGSTTFATATFDYTNATDGTVTLDGSVINYTGLEPIVMNSGTVTDAIYNLPSGTVTRATLTDNGTSLTLNAPTFELTTIPEPTGSLTINGGTVGDSITTSAAVSIPSSLTVTVADLYLGGNLSTNGNAMLFGSDVVLLSNAVIDTTGGGATTAGANITFNGGVLGIDAANNNLDLNAGTAGNVVFQQGITTGYHAGDGNSVTGEAEQYTSRNVVIPQGDNWFVVPDEDPGAGTLIGARGGRYVQSLPDSAGGGGGPLVPPSIEYKMQIDTPGTYQLYVRWANNRDVGGGGNSDSMFADVIELKDGTTPTLGTGSNLVPDWFQLGQNTSTFNWDAGGGAEVNASGEPGNPIRFPIATPGVYTLRFSQREDGSAVDAFVFQLQGLAAPTGTSTGPAAAPVLLDVVITDANNVTSNDRIEAASFTQNVVQGATQLNHDVNVTGAFDILKGTATVTGDLTADTSRVGIANNTPGVASLTVTGGAVVIGNGDGTLDLGVRSTSFSGNMSTTTGVLNLSAATSVTIDVTNVRIGNIVGAPNAEGGARGDLILSNAGQNVITANTFVAGLSSTRGNQHLSTIELGGGSNTINVNTLELGEQKSQAQITMDAGGTLTLNGQGGAGTTATVNLGQTANGTGAVGLGVIDLTGGTVNAELNILRLGAYGPAGSASGTGNFIFDAGTITANSIGYALNGAGASGTITQRGGSFTVNGNVTEGAGSSTLNIENGTFSVVGGDLIVDNVVVGLNGGTGSLTASGGVVDIGEGAGDTFAIGRTTVSTTPLSSGTVNFANATSVNINVPDLLIGVSSSTADPASSVGSLTLSAAGTNTITANSVVAGESPTAGNTSTPSTIVLGGAANNVNTNLFVIGGNKSFGTVTIASGGTLTLNGMTGPGSETDLLIGDNNVDTSTFAGGVLNLSGGTFNAELDELRLGRHGQGAGNGTGSLTFDAGTVTANSVVLGEAGALGTSSAPQNTTATVVINGGSFTATNLTLGLNGATGSFTANGGTVSLGNGTTSNVFVGRRNEDVTLNAVYVSRLNLGGANTVTVNVNEFGIGTVTGGGSGQGRPGGTVILGADNQITATLIDIANSPSVGLGGHNNTLSLGAANIISADTLRVAGSKGSAQLIFANTGSTASINTAGDRGDLRIGDQIVGTGGGSGGSVNFTGSTVTAFFDDLVVASKPNSASGNTSGSLTFDMGTIDANNVQLGVRTNAGTAGNVTGTINQNGGTFQFGTLSQGGGSHAYNFAAGTLGNQAGANAVVQNVTITLSTAGPQIINVDAGQTFTVNAAANISGTGAVQKTDEGTLILPGTITYTGTTAVNGGTLQVDGSTAAGNAITVNSGGTLAGDGVVNSSATAVAGGIIAPGPGVEILTVGNGSFLAPNAELQLELQGAATPGTNYDQLSVTGSLDLGGSTLNAILGGGYVPAPGDSLTIVTTTGGVTGTFAGLAEGATFFLAGQPVEITYLANGENDVVISYDTTIVVDADNESAALDNDINVSLSGANLVVTVDGNTAVNAPLANFTSLTINGQTGNDILTIDYSGGNPFPTGGIFFNGDANVPTDGLNPVGDQLVVTGGTLATVTHNMTTASSGTVTLGSDLLTYTTLENPVDLTGATIGTLALNLPAGADVATLADSGANTLFSAPTVVGTLFAAPTATLNVTGDAADSVAVSGDVDLGGANINLGTSLASVDFNAGGSVTTTGNVSIDAAAVTSADAGVDVIASDLTVTAATGIDLDTTVANITATTSGTGDINLDETNGATLVNIDASAGDATATSTTGNLAVTTVSASGNVVLTATAGAITDANAAANNVTAADLNATAATGIDLDTTIATLTASGTGAGAITIDDLNALEITSATNTGGAITIGSGGTLTNAGTVNASGAATLNAGSDLTLNVGSTSTAGGVLTLNGGAGGVTMSIFGTISGSSVAVNGGAGGDTIIIDSNGGTASDGGTVENILAPLTVNGGGGTDTLTLDDSGDATADAGIMITSTSVQGLVDGNGASSITLASVETLLVELGNGGNTVDLNSVNGGALTSVTVNGGTGDDTFDVTPGFTTVININADAPGMGAVPGDTLNFDLSAIDKPIVFPATSDGLFNGLVGAMTTATINWTSIESFTINNETVTVGELFVEATSGDDRIIFRERLGGVQVQVGMLFFPLNGSAYPIVPNMKLLAYGRDGNDEIIVGGALNLPVLFDGGMGNDYLAGGINNDTLIGGEGNDRMLGSEGNNFLDGGLGNDFMDARSGNDVMFGGDGDGNDELNAGAGDDILDGGEGNDILFGHLGSDLIVGRGGMDTVNGYGGNDVILGGDADDTLIGGVENDLILGGLGSDRILGDGGSDDLVGGTSELDADIIAALNAMMATLGSSLADADTANGTNVRDAIDLWFTTGSDRSGFGLFTDDTTIDDLTGGIDGSMPTPVNQFHTEVDDRYRDFRDGTDMMFM